MNVTKVDRRQAHPPARPEYFQGTVHMQELYRPDRDGEESELVAVFFEAGARTKCSPTWRRSVTPLGRSWWVLPMPARLIAGHGCGWWPRSWPAS